MTALKPLNSTTALVRFLALPLMAGTLVSCGFASGLPEAPSTLGYELADKPPSVTGSGEVDRLPPPPISQGDAFAKLKAPVEYRTTADDTTPASQDLEAPVEMAGLTETAEAESVSDIEFTPLEFEATEGETAEVDGGEFAAPPLETVALGSPAPVYEIPAPAYEAESAQEVASQEVAAYEPAPVPYETAQSIETQPVAPAPVRLETVPVDTYAIGAAPTTPIETVAAPTLPRSPITILRARMANGAVINVHPVVGTPGNASATLARTVLMELGAPVNEEIAREASVAFDLRGRADRNTSGYVSVEWTLHDRAGNIVGSFRERQGGSGWKGLSEDLLVAMGRRVADRINRNGELRKATLYAAAKAPNTVVAAAPAPKSVLVLRKGQNLGSAPMPRTSPRAKVTAPTRIAAAPTVKRPAPPVVKTPARPTPPAPRVVAQAPAPMVAPAPPAAPKVQTQAPRSLAAAPPPSFDTLRAPGNTVAEIAPVVASGPRPLVFQGVSGAPGDGDQSLSREVAKLLRDSGANISSSGGPGALFLTAQVSKTPTGSADRIEIVWRVSDAEGNSIGQVTQANDVPPGMLDRNWGEDAFYAAQGARDGIMQLLQSSGALDS